jgi:selenocysteine lyase/cysteine desulfurase
VNETVFDYSVEEFASFYNDAPSSEQLTLEQFQRHLGGRPIGAIRASFGYANAPEDVNRIVEFMQDMITCKDLR